MRVLHVNTYESAGGAARAAHRLHKALRAAGVDSHMLVADAGPDTADVHRAGGRTAGFVRRCRVALGRRLALMQKTPSNPVLHSLNCFPSGLDRWINDSPFDLVHLHWLGHEMLSIAEIGRIAKPVCWTMHDMWTFCGAEHFDDLAHPGRYRTAYTAGSRPPGYRGPDLDAWVWRRKSRSWAGRRFHLVSPSRWLADCARSSALMAHQPCDVIPNCIDTELFAPMDRHAARLAIGLDPARRYLLFGALSSTSDPRKGFHLLQPALRALAARPDAARDTELLIFGADRPANPVDLGLPARYLGQITDDLLLARLYSAADVFVAPSVQDNLPNSVVESLACATPCVAFAIGGMTDLIEPGVNGLLAAPGDAAGLAAALEEVLRDPPDRSCIRSRSLEVHAEAVVARRHQRLYTSILAAHSGERP